MRSAFGVFRILIVYGEVVQQLPMLAVRAFIMALSKKDLGCLFYNK